MEFRRLASRSDRIRDRRRREVATARCFSRLSRFALLSSASFAFTARAFAADGYSGARIEEEVVVTPKGAKVITLYPAEELPIANSH